VRRVDGVAPRVWGAKEFRSRADTDGGEFSEFIVQATLTRAIAVFGTVALLGIDGGSIRAVALPARRPSR
jgi:hypothetical protein